MMKLSHRLLVALALTLCLGATWMPTQVSAPNERTRLYLAHALVTRGELRVTPEWERWGQIFDIARYEGEFYSDKAPGSSLLIAPAVAVYTKVNPSYTIEDLLMVGRRAMLVCTFVGLFALLSTLSLLGVAARHAALVALLLAWGSNLMHYGHSYFGHGLVLTCILLMMWALAAALCRRSGATPDADGPPDAAWSPTRRQQAQLALAGVASGAAFAIEYQGALIAVALLIGLLSDAQTRRWSVLWPIGAGLFLPVLTTLGYNYLAFDNPLTTSYGLLYFQVSKEVHAKGLWGISLPSGAAIRGLLLSPARGLLFSCPALLFGLSLWRSGYRGPRWLTVTALCIIAAYLYVVTSFGVWSAGWGMGPRLLLPLLAPLALLLGLRMETLARGPALSVLLALGLCSVVSNALLTVTFAEVPSEVVVPLRSSALPLLARGLCSPSLLPPWLWLTLVVGATLGAGALYVRAQRAPIVWRVFALALVLWPLLMWTFPEARHKDVREHLAFVTKLVAPSD